MQYSKVEKNGSSLDIANNLKVAFLGKFCQLSTFRSGNQYESLTQFITLLNSDSYQINFWIVCFFFQIRHFEVISDVQ